MKIITNYDYIDKRKWARFIANHKDGNIFQTPEMYEVYKNTKNYEPVYLSVVDENKNLLGSLLAVIQKEHSGLLGKLSSRAIIWGGPLVIDNNIEVLNYILTEFNKIIKRKAIYSQFRNMWQFSDEEKKIFVKNGFLYEDHLDIIHDLTKNIDDQLMLIHKGRRKNFRRAIKKNVQFNEIIDINELNDSLSLIHETYKRVKLPMPDNSLFVAAFKTLYKKNMVKFFKATFRDRIIGLRFVLCYNSLVYDWFAGSSQDDLDKYPNDYLPWKVIEWSHMNGYDIFDFGGAGKPNEEYGVRDYKLKFGGILVDWGRFEKVNKPLLLKIAELGFSVWKKIN